MKARFFLVGLIVVASGLAACGGGGGGGGFSPTSAPSTPPPATPTPTFPPQFPAKVGDAFNYAGTLSNDKTFAQPAASPLPPQNLSATVSRAVTVQSGGTAPVFQTVESDAYPLQTTTLTTDATYGFSNGSGGAFSILESGFTSKDSLGNTVSYGYPAPGITIVQFPLKAGNAWTNSPAVTITENDADGTSSTRTYAGDGSYTDNETLPYGATAAIVENADGSGSYKSNAFASAEDEFDFSAPSGGEITVSGLFPPPPTPTPNPPGSPSPTPNATATPKVVQIAAWYTAGTPLYKESDADQGSVAIPSACGVPSSIGAQAEQLQQQISRLDTVLGLVETQTTNTYLITNVGTVCVQMQDVTNAYYDYQGDVAPGQPGVTIGFFAYYPKPYQTTTIAETLGMQSETVQSTGKRAAASVSRRSASLSPVRFAEYVSGRASFLRAVARERQARVKAMHHAFELYVKRMEGVR